MTFDIYDVWNASGEEEIRITRTGADVSEAAMLLQLDEDDVLWAIEEAGQCDSGTMVAVPEGTTGPIIPWR